MRRWILFSELHQLRSAKYANVFAMFIRVKKDLLSRTIFRPRWLQTQNVFYRGRDWEKVQQAGSLYFCFSAGLALKSQASGRNLVSEQWRERARERVANQHWKEPKAVNKLFKVPRQIPPEIRFPEYEIYNILIHNLSKLMTQYSGFSTRVQWI